MRILEIDIRSHFHAPLATLLTSPAVPPAAKKMRLLAARRLDGWTVVFLVVQAFLKSPALNALAPTQSELPFLVAQLVVLMLFVGFGIVAARRFRDPV